MKPTVISVDWDFFIYNGEFDLIELPSGQKAPGLFVYDFGHSEGWGKAMHDIAWESRVGMFDAMELDLFEEHTFRPDRGTTPYYEFTPKIEERWPGVTEVDTFVADSHSWAGMLCKDTSEALHRPLRVISFDAHHDLGYGEGSFKRRAAQIFNEGRIACDDWLFVGLVKGWIDEVVVVYPDWRGLKEWRYESPANSEVVEEEQHIEEIKRPHLKHLMDKITITTWSEYMSTGREIGTEVVSNIICRSSGWTPPYLDEDFLAFTSGFNVAACLDCMHPDITVGAFNACQPRAMRDADTLRVEAKERTAQLRQMQALAERAQELVTSGKYATLPEAMAVLAIEEEAS